MTLPDVPIDHGNYDKQINDAGLSASHIASTALSLMGQKAEAMEVLAAVTSK
jgi:1-deoxy-D-xylulose-5-phosphate synthase